MLKPQFFRFIYLFIFRQKSKQPQLKAADKKFFRSLKNVLPGLDRTLLVLVGSFELLFSSSSSSSHLITVAATQPVASPAFKFWIPRLFPPHCSLCSSIPARRRAIKQTRTSRQVSRRRSRSEKQPGSRPSSPFLPEKRRCTVFTGQVILTRASH